MIQEDYVSSEVAKMLENKGFDEKCRASYNKDGNFLIHKNFYFQLECGDGYLAPTLQMACKWLREVHNKHCDIGYDIDLEWYFQINDLKETVEYDYPEPKIFHAKNEIGFKTYEEAVEAAIKYTLENLI